MRYDSFKAVKGNFLTTNQSKGDGRRFKTENNQVRGENGAL